MLRQAYSLARRTLPPANPRDETYVPSADDEYYEKITDAIRDDLPYGVEWQECDLSRKQEDASFYALYPKLTGEIRNRDYLNEIIGKAGASL